jgi:hypothetical protein
VCNEKITGRAAIIASQIINISINTAIKDIDEPTEETIFHEV